MLQKFILVKIYPRKNLFSQKFILVKIFPR